MADWSEGYMAEIGYTFGYCPELNPARLRLAFLNAGHAFPDVDTACELGFGQGLSVNIHAAASITRWYGTDFNPSQAGFAQELAAASGAGTRLYLASPVTGGAHVVTRTEQLFLLARSAGVADPGDWARFATGLYAQQSERLLRDGKPIDSPEEQAAELLVQADAFLTNHLPLLQALRIAA
jgi:hypothetical protein